MAGRAWPIAGLPRHGVIRWTIRRKAAIVVAVAWGTVTRDEARCHYGLSEEELRSWEQAFEAHGLLGLRVTRLKGCGRVRQVLQKDGR